MADEKPDRSRFKSPKLPKLPKPREIPGKILAVFREGLTSVFGKMGALLRFVLESKVKPLLQRADDALHRVPGYALARRIVGGILGLTMGFMRRRRANMSRRIARLREIKENFPAPAQFPGWVVRGIINGMKRPVIRWKVMLIGGAAFMFILFLATVQFPLTTNPTFCGSCHSMRPEFYTWRVSSHRRITCYSCHVKPGLFWLIRDHLVDGPLGMLKEFVTGYEDPMNFSSHVGLTKMPVMNCQRCHSPGNRRFTTTRGLKMNHEKHLKRGVRCTVCHNRITHPIRGYKNNMKMQACFRCHGAKKNEELIEELEHLSKEKPGEFARYGTLAEAIKADKPKPKCSLCHEPEWNLKPRSHLLADWAPTRSYEVPTYTGQSQREMWEYQSIKITTQPRPAKLSRIYNHARYAKSNPAYCQMCHDKKKFCNKCHRLDMPHVRPWWDRHGSTVVASFPQSLGPRPSTIESNVQKILCTRCHQSKNFCLDCHKKTVFPHATPWAPVHGDLAKKEGFKEVCTTCHSYDNFCMKCHNGVEMPHSKRWLGKHFAFLKDKPTSICMRCHVKTQCERCHSRHKGHKMWTILNPNEFTRPPKGSE